MFDIKMTINGKPMTESNFRDALERATYQAIVSDFKNKINSILTEEEAAQITIDVVGSGMNDLSFNVKGPEEIVNKTKKAFAQ